MVKLLGILIILSSCGVDTHKGRTSSNCYDSAGDVNGDGKESTLDCIGPIGESGPLDPINKDIDPDDVILDGDKRGPRGLAGKDGAQGPEGPQGAPGRDGVDGEDGIDGKDGEDGATGPQGDPGQDGADGQDGKDGADGQDGATGPQGPAGQDGKDGQDYTPPVTLEGFYTFPNYSIIWIVQTSTGDMVILESEIFTENFDSSTASHPELPRGPYSVYPGHMITTTWEQRYRSRDDIDKDGTTNSLTGTHTTTVTLSLDENNKLKLHIIIRDGLNILLERTIISN